MSMSLTIAGLQKMTLLDYPGHVACTVFLQGCNFRCPFCHNSDLLPGSGEAFMTAEEFLDFLKKRTGLLDAVCVSGGEPTLQKELPELLQAIKSLGFKVKLDTNGYRPEVLKALVEAGLVDYVAMDVKNSPDRYGQTVGIPGVNISAVEESLRFLIGGAVAYELRTTLVQQLHDEAGILRMGQWLASLVPGKKPAALYLQLFADRESVAFAGLSAPEEAEVDRYRHLLTPFVEQVSLRGE